MSKNWITEGKVRKGGVNPPQPSTDRPPPPGGSGKTISGDDPKDLAEQILALNKKDMNKYAFKEGQVINKYGPIFPKPNSPVLKDILYDQKNMIKLCDRCIKYNVFYLCETCQRKLENIFL